MPSSFLNGSGNLVIAGSEPESGRAATEQSALQDKINSFKIYPVLSIGFTVGF